VTAGRHGLRTLGPVRSDSDPIPNVDFIHLRARRRRGARRDRRGPRSYPAHRPPGQQRRRRARRRGEETSADEARALFGDELLRHRLAHQRRPAGDARAEEAP